MIKIPSLIKNRNTEPDNQTDIYYNVTISARTSVEKGAQGLPTASFRENRVEPIIEDPSEYMLAVERFKVPQLSIPIFIWKDDRFVLEMRFDGASAFRNLQFIPNTSGVDDLYGPSIWNYQELLDSLNQALEAAFLDLKALKPLAPPTEAPFVTYEASSQLFKLNAEQLYDVNGPPTIEIFWNEELYQLFSFNGFNNIFTPVQNQLLIKNEYNNKTTINGKPYFSTFGEYNTLTLWNDLASIVFETSTIPVAQELEPGQTNVTQRIITDFQPLEAPNDRESFQYYPQGPLRWYDLKSKYPLRSIDVTVKWTDKQGNRYPIYLEDDNSVYIKLAFKKRSEVVQAYNEEA